MKKWLIWGTMVILLGVIAIPAFAGDSGSQQWFQQLFDAKKARVDSMVRSGQLTEEQGQVLKEHFDRMYLWHEENGFTCPGGGMGPGQGNGSRWMNDSDGNGTFAGSGAERGFCGGMGSGMMRGGCGLSEVSSNVY